MQARAAKLAFGMLPKAVRVSRNHQSKVAVSSLCALMRGLEVSRALHLTRTPSHNGYRDLSGDLQRAIDRCSPAIRVKLTYRSLQCDGRETLARPVVARAPAPQLKSTETFMTFIRRWFVPPIVVPAFFVILMLAYEAFR